MVAELVTYYAESRVSSAAAATPRPRALAQNHSALWQQRGAQRSAHQPSHADHGTQDEKTRRVHQAGQPALPGVGQVHSEYVPLRNTAGCAPGRM